MTDDKLFALVAMMSLLLWLLGRGALPNPQHRRIALTAAYGLIGAGIVYALVQSALWFAR